MKLEIIDSLENGDKEKTQIKNTNEQYETLKNRMYKLLCNKPYNANQNHVNKIAAQMRYLEKMIRPEVKEIS